MSFLIYFRKSLPTLIFRWGVVIIGSYLYNHVIRYLNDKQPANQTILDGIYIQLFQYMILEGWMIGISMSTKEIFGTVPWILAIIIGWGAYLTRNLFGIQFFICLLVKYVLIFKQEVFEETYDIRILRWIR